MRAFTAVVLVFLFGCAERSGPASDTASSGIRGRVVAAPTCPVETGDPACEPRPVAARVSVTGLDGSTEKRVDTGADGTFAITLLPGEYEIVAEAIGPEGRLTPKPMRVIVAEGKTTQVQVVLDTGIRSPG